MNRIYLYALVSLFGVGALSSCGSSKKGGAVSDKTGYSYNKRENGGFEVKTSFKRGPGPGLIEIEGGEFVMGGSGVEIPGQDLGMYNYKRQVTLSSFYMDETEVSNTNWLEYLHWIRTTFRGKEELAQYYYEALPDTLVWRRPLSYNEPYVNNYLRHPAYGDYPVVGVNWQQAAEYCVWRTDRVNEFVLREKGIMTPFKDLNKPTAKGGAPVKRSDTIYNTEAYLNGQNKDLGKNAPLDLSADAAAGKGKSAPRRNVRLEDGEILQPYRLPTEAEWEYAALGLIGNTQYSNINEKRVYPWNGLGITSSKKSTRGMILANFKRGKGDYMGVGGSLNDKGSITSSVRSFTPNDFGLYNMAGNVSEWVQDVYRPNTYEATEGLNPFRGNEYTDKERDPQSNSIKLDGKGRPMMKPAVTGVKQTWAQLQSNYVDSSYKADQRGYRDAQTALANGEVLTLYNDRSRVYKGGSWNDQAIWLNPAARRYLQEDESAADIGFRCAMTMLGSSEVRSAGKAQFKNKPAKPFKVK
ncbi:SUMF1/EgtB/PvdO family nonheme iron enzyme [Pedobacter xixiisoli]|uniref:Gliding motility-associated lipoprotein GldJ n=1 Tax=Pedobacter xixiisoli TaxID=1476464 RepID=A0A286AE21_9SPHI|nr:SUMF1/EgtB/PvdO family nonheme iron enzyme [Pedobacter xixiisoli]SOD20151.1 gliding motility-associated lipoprotein GldJ [Pedobacter xixiisoli]